MIAAPLLLALTAPAEAPAPATSAPSTESTPPPAETVTPPAPAEEPGAASTTQPSAAPPAVAPPAPSETSARPGPTVAEAHSLANMDQPPAPSAHLVLKIAAGAFYTQIFTVRTYGGEGFATVGSSHGDFTVDAGILFARGRTEHGLAVTKARAAASLEWSQGLLRLGFGPSIGFLTMDRATFTQDSLPREQPSIGQFSLGAEIHASMDLVRAVSGSALFLRLSFDVEPGAWVSPALLLGYRLDAAPRASR